MAATFTTKQTSNQTMQQPNHKTSTTNQTSQTLNKPVNNLNEHHQTNQHIKTQFINQYINFLVMGKKHELCTGRQIGGVLDRSVRCV